MVRFIANLHVKKVLALTTASSRINFALTCVLRLTRPRHLIPTFEDGLFGYSLIVRLSRLRLRRM